MRTIKERPIFFIYEFYPLFLSSVSLSLSITRMYIVCALLLLLSYGAIYICVSIFSVPVL